jgi:hypothetical protein
MSFKRIQASTGPQQSHLAKPEPGASAHSLPILAFLHYPTSAILAPLSLTRIGEERTLPRFKALIRR